MSKTYSAGIATAYGAAKQGGYQGSYTDFCNDIAQLGNITAELGDISADATTLEAGSPATASYNDGVFAFGIPRGNTGAQGERGETGAKGDKGDTGETGATGATGNGIASIAKTATVGLVDTYTITFTDGTTTTFDVTNGAEAIDDTLSIAGRAADAKATGDAVNDLKSDLQTVEKAVSLESETTGEQIMLGSNVMSVTVDTESSLDVLHTGKNLLKFPYQFNSLTSNGITFTVNNDGTVKAEGTATADAIFQIIKDNNRRPLKAGTYTLSGVDANSNDGTRTNNLTLGITNVGEKKDYGNGVSFALSADNTIYLRWIIYSGKTVNTILRPQIELGSTVTSYESYTGETLTIDGTENVDLYDGINVFSASSSFTIGYDVLKKASPIYNLKDYAVGDGVTDDTVAINKALTDAAGGTLLISSGTYLFSGTLNVHSGTRVIGCGESSLFKLANTYSLTSYTWRSDAGGYYQNRYPMIATDADSQGCILENFAVIGQTNAFKDENEDGVCVRGNQHIVRNLKLSKINYFPDSFSGRTCITPAWGITVINADIVSVENCDVDECGYECYGVEASDSVTIDSCKSGVGNQTSIQIHRNVHHCRIENCTMLRSSSCMTMDADPSTPMSDIHIAHNLIQGVVNFVAGGENEIYITNNNIGGGVNCNNQAYRKKLFLRGNKIGNRVGTYHDECVMTDNIIDVSTGYYMIIHHGNKCVIENNLGVGTVTDILITPHDS